MLLTANISFIFAFDIQWINLPFCIDLNWSTSDWIFFSTALHSASILTIYYSMFVQQYSQIGVSNCSCFDFKAFNISHARFWQMLILLLVLLFHSLPNSPQIRIRLVASSLVLDILWNLFIPQIINSFLVYNICCYLIYIQIIITFIDICSETLHFCR